MNWERNEERKQHWTHGKSALEILDVMDQMRTHIVSARWKHMELMATVILCTELFYNFKILGEDGGRNKENVENLIQAFLGKNDK